MATSKYSSQKKSFRLKVYFSLISSIILLLLGTSLIFLAAVNNGFGWQANDQPKAVQAEVISVNRVPEKIYLPKLNRSLEISDGYFEDNHWVISKTGVSYLTTSGKLGEVGNVVLYGHNTRDVLGGLWKVQNGDIVEVVASDGKVYKYEIFERREVKPNALEILDSTQDARLTLFTCSGFLDTARFVVVGKLI